MKWYITAVVLVVGIALFGAKLAQRPVFAPNEALAFNTEAWGTYKYGYDFLAQNPISYKSSFILGRMEKLAWCESRGNEKAINPNDVGSPSYGKYQFKLRTWLAYSPSQFPTKSALELEGLLLNGKAQDEVVYRMLKENLYSHWKNCSLKYGWL